MATAFTVGDYVRVVNPDSPDYERTGEIVRHNPAQPQSPWVVDFGFTHGIAQFAAWELDGRNPIREWQDRPGTHDPF